MITLRPMEDTMADYTAMRSWFLEPELQQWVWCDEKGEKDVSLERIIEKYGQRIKHPADVFPYFILKNGNPVGFIQYYFQTPTTVGLDMWIGTPADRGQGYGSEALRQMAQLIRCKHPSVTELFIDPEAENQRAVRCYRKAGFQDAGTFTDEEGAHCLLLKMHFDAESGTKEL